MRTLCFDVETSGLFTKNANYKDLDKFNTSRLVSISWIISQGDSIIEQSYFVIRPDTWKIGKESTDVHGITHEYACENGKNAIEVLNQFIIDVRRVSTIIAHNINFDETIIKSELFRLNLIDELVDFSSKHKICTMIKGRQYMKVRKYPKLSELYKHLYNDEIQNAHNAIFDTKYCFLCYIKLFPSNPDVFYFGDKEVTLTDEQSSMVFETIDTNMLIVAGAGSGKTTSIISRLKYMLDQNIPEDCIIFTTFTRNASQDMKAKLFDIMGFECNIKVGTFDSVARSYVERYSSKEISNVEEYAGEFLNLIKKRPEIIKNILYFLIDEVQDINEVQHAIMLEFYKNGTYIIGIGDDYQNIYEFRGSDIKYIINFEKTFSPCQRHTLTKNFRSTKYIVDLSNRVIEKNKNQIHKNMVSMKDESTYHEVPIVRTFVNSEQQYEYILKELNNLISTGVDPSSICILCQTNKPLLELKKQLIDNNIAHYFCSSEEDSQKDNCINLKTIHKAKGLEWDTVFLISMTDDTNKNIFHYNKNDKSRCVRLLEANRRLFYVGITRAKSKLFVLSNGEMTRFI